MSYQAALERDGLPDSDRAALEACVSALDEAGSQEARSPGWDCCGSGLNAGRGAVAGPFCAWALPWPLRTVMGRWPALCASGGLPECGE